MKKVNDEVYKCEVCGKEFKKEGWCRQHEYQAHKGGSMGKEKVEKVEKAENTRCELCGYSLRLLNTKNMYERKAVSMGYEKICISCDELY